MKKIHFLFLLIGFCLTSCTTHYLSTLATLSPDMSKNDNGEFVVENDSLRITYNFNGASSPIRIVVYNKLSIPLYVDWGRSALIIDNTSISYTGETIGLPNNVDEYTHNTELTSSISVVPPNSNISNMQLYLNADFKGVRNSDFSSHPAKMAVSDGEKSVEVKQASFSPYTTPLAFRSLLTFQYQNGPYFHFMSDFYVDKILKSDNDISYKQLTDNLKDKGNLLYTKDENNKLGEAILSTTIAVGLTAVDVWLNNEVYNNSNY